MATTLICVAAVGQSTGGDSLEPRYNLAKGKLNHGTDTAAAEHAAEGTSPVRAGSDTAAAGAAHVQCPLLAATSGTSAACGRSAELLLQVLPLNPEQIETPQLHQSKWWWRASVFHVDGKCFVGNGNHRGIQAKGASHRRGVEHFFAIASIRSCAKRVGRRGLRITKNRRDTST
jgi:hypothetical protein